MDNRVRCGLGHFFSVCCLLAAVLIAGCAAPQVKERTFPDFVAIIVVQSGDTLSSLASKYLNDPSKDWLIAEFNGITAISPGQELIIPLKPFKRGGLTAKGYQTVPVLSYHKFSLNKSNKMTVTKAAFEEQMQMLRDKGYRVITMGQLFDFFEFEGQVPEKSVVITIDDGWRSTYDIAFPILKKYGYPATLFVYTDLITGSKKTLTWNLVKEMADNGIDIQCHSKTHRDFTVMGEKESFREYFETINKELSVSARMVKKRSNIDCKYFAYPYGETNHLIIALLKKYGYRGAFIAKRGSNPFFVNNYRIKRSMVYGDFNLKQFERNLNVYSNRGLK